MEKGIWGQGVIEKKIATLSAYEKSQKAINVHMRAGVERARIFIRVALAHGSQKLSTINSS